jgi:hypothetical protein
MFAYPKEISTLSTSAKEVLLFLLLIPLSCLLIFSPVCTVAVIQQQFSDTACTALQTTFAGAPVGCQTNIIYNCTWDATTIPVPKGGDFVVQSYYPDDTCTGQVQFFVGQADNTCYTNGAGTSEYLDYPYVEVYGDSTDCTGSHSTNNDVNGCVQDDSHDTDSYKYFNTSLVGKCIHGQCASHFYFL